MYTLDDVKKVQQRLLEMGKAIKLILEKYDIAYSVAYGSLLGTIRHQGFIPWDDDFDLFLPEEGYVKALEVLRKELPSDMFLEDEHSEPMFFHGWAHVKDLNSETFCDLFPQDGNYAHHGITIDLHVSRRIPENNERLYRAEENLAYQKRKLKHNFLTLEEYEKKAKELEQIIAEEQYNKEHPSKREIYAFKIFYDDRIYPEELFPLKQYMFEDTTFLGPANPYPLLERCYGNWQQLPPEEKRHPHYSDVIFK